MAVRILETRRGRDAESVEFVKVRVYLHGEKFELHDALDDMKIHIDEEVREKIIYAFYEEVLDYWVDLRTGEVSLHLDSNKQ